MEKDLGVPEDHCIVDTKDLDKMMVFLIQNPQVFQFIVGKGEFERQWGEPLPEMVLIQPERPVPPPDKEEWVPGLFGLRFSKWLRKWRKTL